MKPVPSLIRVALSVIASWFIAITVLEVTLHMLPTTPGYLPDHLE
jgi:hypothetical protein